MTHWHSFTDRLPEEGQAIATIRIDGSGGDTFRVVEGWLTFINYAYEKERLDRERLYELTDAKHEYSLWSALPEGFKLWGEE